MPHHSNYNVMVCVFCIKEGGIGIFGFAVLAIFQTGFSVFVAKDFGFSVLVVIAVCGFFVFQHLVFGFREKYQRFFGFGTRCGFSYFVLFWVPVSVRFEQHLISNSRETPKLFRGMRNKINVMVGDQASPLTPGGHLGIFWVGMRRPGLQIGTPFQKKIPLKLIPRSKNGPIFYTQFQYSP